MLFADCAECSAEKHLFVSFRDDRRGVNPAQIRNLLGACMTDLPDQPGTPSRRAVMTGIGATALAASALPGPAAAQQATWPADGQTFETARLLDYARALARRPYAATPVDLPEPFGSLNAEQFGMIRAKPTSHLLHEQGPGLAIEPLHRGFVYKEPVALFVIVDGVVRRIPYDPALFDFGRLTVPASLPDLGYSGFRLFGDPVDGKDREAAIFQGATFFKALARGQTYGLQARALALKVAEARGEEFPFFRAIWIERASGNAGAIVHALFDSESATGVMRATIRPGDVTLVDIETNIFARQVLDHFGIAAMSGTYLFGPGERRSSDDVRPAVFETNGLQMLRGNGEWVWRPLRNPPTLQISVFADENPRGFGLLQRERDFGQFQDDDARLERRPSLWIEPIGDWGTGALQLIEIPSDSEVNDNIVAYWRPRTPVQPGAEASFSYRQFWCWQPPERPAVASVVQTRFGRGSSGRRRRFIVDFAGDMLGDAKTVMEMTPAITASAGSIQNIRVLPYTDRKMCRVIFELDPGNEQLCELRLIINAGATPVTETWLYRWTS